MAREGRREVKEVRITVLIYPCTLTYQSIARCEWLTETLINDRDRDSKGMMPCVVTLIEDNQREVSRFTLTREVK